MAPAWWLNFRSAVALSLCWLGSKKANCLTVHGHVNLFFAWCCRVWALGTLCRGTSSYCRASGACLYMQLFGRLLPPVCVSTTCSPINLSVHVIARLQRTYGGLAHRAVFVAGAVRAAFQPLLHRSVCFWLCGMEGGRNRKASSVHGSVGAGTPTAVLVAAACAGPLLLTSQALLWCALLRPLRACVGVVCVCVSSASTVG